MVDCYLCIVANILVDVLQQVASCERVRRRAVCETDDLRRRSDIVPVQYV
jgi:hypothetical protein